MRITTEHTAFQTLLPTLHLGAPSPWFRVSPLGRNDRPLDTTVHRLRDAYGRHLVLYRVPTGRRCRFDEHRAVGLAVNRLLDHSDALHIVSEVKTASAHELALNGIDTRFAPACMALFSERQALGFGNDLAASLVAIHRQTLYPVTPPQRTLDGARLIHRLHRLVERHPESYSVVSRLLQRLYFALDGQGERPKTLCLSPNAPFHTVVHSATLRLIYPFVVRLTRDDPWLDLARHLALFVDHWLPLRVFTIDLYFDLDPPPAFFHVLFLRELDERLRLLDGTPSPYVIRLVLDRLSALAATYRPRSPFPVWYRIGCRKARCPRQRT